MVNEDSVRVSDRALELLRLELSELRGNQTVAASGWRLVLAIQYAVSSLLCVEIRSLGLTIVLTVATFATAIWVRSYNKDLENLSTKYKDQLLDNLQKSDMDSFLAAEYDRKLWQKGGKYLSFRLEPYWIPLTTTLTIWTIFFVLLSPKA